MLAIEEARRAGTISSRASKGARDLLPEQMLARHAVIEKIRAVYERYGFVPLHTPSIEFLHVLNGSAGQDAQNAIFRVVGPEREALGLRFDLTVPLARVIAEYPSLPRPFRRYQISPVWRMEDPGKGRFREFTQFDLDSVGVESEIADTEIIAAMCDTLAALDFGAYRVRFSSRSILNILLDFADIPHTLVVDIIRVLDKLDKVGLEKVSRELTTGYRDENGHAVRGLGLRSSQVDRVEAFLRVRGEKRSDVIVELRSLFSHISGAADAIEGVDRISRNLTALRYGDDRVVLDVAIARGLSYYTGPVFEAIALDAPQFGSIFGGGRYDDLVMRFLGERMPATGASIGIDRLLEVLAHLHRVGTRKATARVLVANVDRSLTADYLDMTWLLRRAEIPTEFYLGTESDLSKQLKYADQYGIPIVLIYGRHEHERGMVTLKNMGTSEESPSTTGERAGVRAARPGQLTAQRSALVEAVKRMLTVGASHV